MHLSSPWLARSEYSGLLLHLSAEGCGLHWDISWQSSKGVEHLLQQAVPKGWDQETLRVHDLYEE